jgi:hypothetical protein
MMLEAAVRELLFEAAACHGHEPAILGRAVDSQLDCLQNEDLRSHLFLNLYRYQTQAYLREMELV